MAHRVRAIRALIQAEGFSETRHMIQSSVEPSGGLPSERFNPISSPMEQSTALCFSPLILRRNS
ncbi:hypothetical protein MUK42_34930 [Musa troglodytarum]|uniref:Uncharacterized protein n=1 Tax=Musa troglodytarum TaxID=320322 RepID=A0A9E7GCQ4_9LILI|nr:hypothetical protein MUK42_34930 [Musa troglodytarum]